MGNVIAIHQRRQFTLDEARELLPIVRRVTQSAFDEVKQKAAELSYVSDPSRREQTEEKIRKTFLEWQEKIQKLGCDAKGMWLVDFDTGEGYYCWHYPEPELNHYHSYADGFRGRIQLS